MAAAAVVMMMMMVVVVYETEYGQSTYQPAMPSLPLNP